MIAAVGRVCRIGTAVLALAVLFGSLAPSGASAVSPAAPPQLAPPHPVDIYGDSVIGGGAPQIVTRLKANGWAPRVFAVPGVSIEQIAAAVISAPRVSDVVVIGAGYSYFWKPLVLRRDVDALLYALSVRGVRRVIWLNVREDRPERRDVNNALNTAWQRWGNLEVADWNRLSRDQPGVFFADGHHLLPAGGRLMARLINERLVAYAKHTPRAAPPVYGERPRESPAVAVYGPTGMIYQPLANAANAIVTRSPFAGIASTPSGNGYWLAQRDGGVSHFGDALPHGSARGIALHAQIIGIAATPSGNGYWLVAADGGVFSFGDARFHGSTGLIHLAQPVVGMTPTRTGKGYWLVAADGGVFSFGDARFYGSTGAIHLAEPIVGMAAHPSGRGYWIVAYDGGIFTFGAARYHGSAATTPRYWKIAAMASTPDGNGYWVLAANGETISYGSAPAVASQTSLLRLFTDIANRRDGGFWLLAQGPPSHH
ncbi:MAG: Esterase [Actinomycetia bacterium]|nr:Esterase [Actinomycetes bacterium]